MFRILVLTDGAYRDREPDADGWLDSPVFGRSFRLRRFQNKLDLTDYELETREP